VGGAAYWPKGVHTGSKSDFNNLFLDFGGCIRIHMPIRGFATASDHPQKEDKDGVYLYKKAEPTGT
jgi:hypothetical protein